MPERSVSAQREPDVAAGQPAFADQRLEFAVAAANGCVRRELGQERLRFGDGHAAVRETRVEHARSPHVVDHRAVEDGVVVGGHGMERQADEGCLDDPVIGDGPVQLRRSNPAMRFQSAMYGEAGDWACSPQRAATASSTPSFCL